MDDTSTVPRQLQVRVTLDDTDAPGPVWRQLQLGSDLTLDVVHELLQAAFAWTDSHLHRFSVGEAFAAPSRWFATDVDLADDDMQGDVPPDAPEREVRLGEVLQAPGDELRYLYDFGDHWDHVLVLEQTCASKPPAEAPRLPSAVVLDGEHAAPEEDSRSSGFFGVDDGPALPWPAFDLAATQREVEAAIVAVRDRPRLSEAPAAVAGLVRRAAPRGGGVVPWHAARAHLFDGDVPLGDDAEDADRVVATAVHPWTRLLQIVGDDGVALTGAGWLPPGVVVELFDVVDPEHHWIGKANREDLTMPVASFRAAAQDLGLVRVQKGRLLRTPAGRAGAASPSKLLEHVLTRLPVGGHPSEQDAGMLALLALATGRSPLDDGLHLLADGVAALGWETARGPLDRHDLRAAADPTLVVLRQLGALRPVRDLQRLSTSDDVGPLGVELARRALRHWPDRPPARRRGALIGSA